MVLPLSLAESWLLSFSSFGLNWLLFDSAAFFQELLRILFCLSDKLCHKFFNFLLLGFSVSHDSLYTLLSVFDVVDLIAHLALLLDLVALLVVFVEGSFNLIESPCGFELTRCVVHLAARHCLTGTARLYVVLDLTLSHVYTARLTLDSDLIEELHQDTVGALQLGGRLAMRALVATCVFFPFFYTVVTEQLFTTLALSRLPHEVQAYQAVEIVLNCVLGLEVLCGAEPSHKLGLEIVRLLLKSLLLAIVIGRHD